GRRSTPLSERSGQPWDVPASRSSIEPRCSSRRPERCRPDLAVPPPASKPPGGERGVTTYRAPGHDTARRRGRHAGVVGATRRDCGVDCAESVIVEPTCAPDGWLPP